MLKKLELIGFKSFAGKTTLDFAEGITAVVGPNGSGKSNVIDALRWLLGERDAKHLRGGKVEDLIFAGTPKKPRVGLAQASVYFDNSSQIFPVEYNEVVVSREVDRGGNSRYFINQAEVRLRDLVDFFAKARLGVRGLVVIGQGESDMFLRSTPFERREMVEEILGLREYQLKKAEAERKFKSTAINLEKVEALVREIAPHLRALKRQTSRWERRGETEGELRGLESIFYGARLAEIKVQLTKVEPEIKRVAARIAEEARELQKLQKNVEATEGLGGEHHQEIKKIREESGKLGEQKSKLVHELGRLEAHAEFLRERETEANDEVDMGRAVPFMKRLKSELQELYTADIETVRSRLVSIVEEIKGLFRVKKHQGLTLAEAEEARAQCSVALASINATLEEYKEKEKNITSRIESASSEFKEALGVYQAKKDAIKELQDEHNRALFEEERWRLKLQDLEAQTQNAFIRFADVRDGAIAVPADFHHATYERNILRLRGELAAMGEVDEALIKETKETEERHAFLTVQAEDLGKALADLADLKNELEVKINTEFTGALTKINKEFTNYFELMFGGGKAVLRIKNKEEDLLEENKEQADAEEDKAPEQIGLDIEVSIPRKRITGLEMLSGGERTLVSIAVLFALAAVSPPPFLVLDEMDAALDERNARRFADMLRELAKKTQFVLVTHNRATMEAAHILYGVTMGEDGTSKVLSLKLE